jgi:hypothetical protein
MKGVVLLLVLATLATCWAQVTLFSDSFDSGLGQWVTSGTTSTTASPRVGSSGLAAKLQLRGRIEHFHSTVGYSNISVSWAMAASSLETGISNDRCRFEFSVNRGASYISLSSLIGGQDTSTFFTYTYNLPVEAWENPNLAISYVAAGDASGDYCYAENVALSGIASPSPPSPPPTATLVTSFQDLSGSGAVTRSSLTFAQLTASSGQIAGPVDLSVFALPTAAAHPINYFHGVLRSLDEFAVGSLVVVRDDFGYANAAERSKIAEIYTDLVQHGSHIIPRVRSYLIGSHPFWEIILLAGRVWNENSDNGWSRVAIPFTLTQKNANCAHNGVLSFLFKTSTVDGRSIANISRAYYQISQETCLYFKVNMWGTIQIQGTTLDLFGVDVLRSSYEYEVNARLQTKPMSGLALDFPGTVTSLIGSEQTTGHTTFSAVEVDGIVYANTYATRNGVHPYPEAVLAPSYSTSKSWLVSLACMVIDNQFASYNLYGQTIKSLIPSASITLWGDVTIAHVLDMASGNRNLAGYEADESSTAMTNYFFLRETHSQKLSYCLTYGSRKNTPGTFWCYTTCQYYILATALRNALKTLSPTSLGLQDYMLSRVFVPLNLSMALRSSKRTYDSILDAAADSRDQEWGGYGLFFTLDDIAKLARFLNAGEGKINGVSIVNYSKLKTALQRNTADPGFTITGLTNPGRYNDGYWASNVYNGLYSTQLSNCGGSYEPYMSGYGGIGVVLLKNKLNYIVVSDDEIYAFATTVLELALHVRQPCSVVYSS